MAREYWDRQKMRDAAERWLKRYGAAPRPIDWNPTDAKRFGDPLAAERFKAGTYPSAKTVKKEYGSWDDAISAWGMVAAPSTPLPRQAAAELADLEQTGMRASPELVVTRIRSWGRARREGTVLDEAAELRLLAAAAIGHAIQLESRRY